MDANLLKKNLEILCNKEGSIILVVIQHLLPFIEHIVAMSIQQLKIIVNQTINAIVILAVNWQRNSSLEHVATEMVA